MNKKQVLIGSMLVSLVLASVVFGVATQETFILDTQNVTFQFNETALNNTNITQNFTFTSSPSEVLNSSTFNYTEVNSEGTDFGNMTQGNTTKWLANNETILGLDTIPVASDWNAVKTVRLNYTNQTEFQVCFGGTVITNWNVTRTIMEVWNNDTSTWEEFYDKNVLFVSNSEKRVGWFVANFTPNITYMNGTEVVYRFNFSGIDDFPSSGSSALSSSGYVFKCYDPTYGRIKWFNTTSAVSISHSLVFARAYPKNGTTDLLTYIKLPKNSTILSASLTLTGYNDSNDNYPENPYLLVNNTLEWYWDANASGGGYERAFFNESRNITISSSTISDFLSSCSENNGWCYLPVQLHSDSAGVIQVSDISFVYHYNVTEKLQTYIPLWERLVNVIVNDTYGRARQINFTSDPVNNITFKYIWINQSTSSDCKLNGTAGSVTTIDGVKVCDVDDIGYNSTYTPIDLRIWDDQMSTGIPLTNDSLLNVIQNYTHQDYYRGTSFWIYAYGNVSINNTDTLEGFQTIHYNFSRGDLDFNFTGNGSNTTISSLDPLYNLSSQIFFRISTNHTVNGSSISWTPRSNDETVRINHSGVFNLTKFKYAYDKPSNMDDNWKVYVCYDSNESLCNVTIQVNWTDITTSVVENRSELLMPETHIDGINSGISYIVTYDKTGASPGGGFTPSNVSGGSRGGTVHISCPDGIYDTFKRECVKTSLEIDPMSFDIKLRGGERGDYDLTIKNTESDEVEIEITSTAFWMIVEPAEVWIKSDDTQNFKVRISAPPEEGKLLAYIKIYKNGIYQISLPVTLTIGESDFWELLFPIQEFLNDIDKFLKSIFFLVANVIWIIIGFTVFGIYNWYIDRRGIAYISFFMALFLFVIYWDIVLHAFGG